MLVIPQCHFIKADGVRCGSPALRGKRLCYFHARSKPRPRHVAPEVPDPGDLMAVLHWTAQGLMRGTLDVKAAGKIIYSVQQMTLTR